MKLNVPLPFDRTESPDEFLSLEAVAEIGKVLDKAGFHAGLVTDHPCPTGRWLDAGGHHAPDPFVMLSLLAAVTNRVRLQTGILVLPYRNPFIIARAVATLDHYSRGRVTLGMGAGYLKGEYRALGVDFERRNDIMDEYLRALKAALSGEEFTFEGTGYQAFGNRIQPGPVQKPHPPLLIGGNSRRAIRRAVELGDAWNPFFTAGGVANAATRTAAMEGEPDLIEGLSYLREQCEKVGRLQPPALVLGGITRPGEKWTAAELIDRIGGYHALGATAAAVHIEGRSRAEWCDNAERMGADVIAKIPA
jgi:probable F420-dependent oxidoreductase